MAKDKTIPRSSSLSFGRDETHMAVGARPLHPIRSGRGGSQIRARQALPAQMLDRLVPIRGQAGQAQVQELLANGNDLAKFGRQMGRLAAGAAPDAEVASAGPAGRVFLVALGCFSTRDQ
jgi:hypothetical protein